MEDFKIWLVENSDVIKITSVDRSGQMSFLIKGEKYTYSFDAIILQDKKFIDDIKYKPGKVLNWLKKNGTLVFP